MARWARTDWLDHGLTRLREAGPAAVTLEAVCASAQRTRGSFYHHFPTIEAFHLALADRWADQNAEQIGAVAVATTTAGQARKTLMRMTSGGDHRLEAAMRALGQDYPAVLDRVRGIDDLREGMLSDLTAAAYGLEETAALGAARLFHSIHLGAQARRPDDIGGYGAEPFALLILALERGLGRDGERTSPAQG